MKLNKKLQCCQRGEVRLVERRCGCCGHSGTFIEGIFSREKKRSSLLSKGQCKRVHNLRGNHYSIQLPSPHLLLPPGGREETSGDRRGDERTGAQYDSFTETIQ